MSNPYQRTFELEQHTPLIHFQHDQQGATLRATEPKPKLDQFIIEQCLKSKGISWDYASEAKKIFKRAAQKTDNDPDKNKWETWLIDDRKKGPAALDYKVKIIASNVTTEPIGKDDKIRLYFGNMGDEYEKNPMGLNWADKVTIKILALNPSLSNKIVELFPYLVARTNFGTRQNKGFGSFFFHSSDSNDYKGIEHYLPQISALNFDQTGWESIGLVIEYYYNRLKSGLDYPNHEKPSFLKDILLKRRRKTWEKTWIQHEFFSKPGTIENAFFTRALLGLPPKFEFPKENKTTIEVKHSKKYVKRSKSPITFKPATFNDKSKVFVIPENFHREPLIGEKFEFNDGSKKKYLKTPDKDLDIDDLLSAYHKLLGKSFTARDYLGKTTIKVNINS